MSTAAPTQDRPTAPGDRPSVTEERDEAMRALVARLARPHRSGGQVVERASLMAAGADFAAAVSWIEAHGGRPEDPIPSKAARGLHSARVSPSAPRPPLRFVLPAAALA
jgi:hypothetical protein